MPGEMLLDLALGFGEEREIPPVAKRARGCPDREGTGVPERIEQARAAAQLADALRAPRQMILFLARRLLERLARRRIASRERLSLVQRLRAHLADMVDPHQRRRMLLVALFAFGNLLRRRRAARLRDSGNRAQRAIELGDQLVECNHFG